MLDAQNDLRARLLDLDTAAVSDAMDSLGICRGLHGIQQRVPGTKIAGPAFTVQYQQLDADSAGFQNAGNYIDQVPEGHVIVVSNDSDITCTNWGDILTTMANLKGIAGTVINGHARDLEYVRKLDYPLFTRGVYMVSAKNRTGVRALNVPVDFDGVTVTPVDWIFGDENGVLVIAEGHLAEVIRRAENVNVTETLIIGAIQSGISLEQARRQFDYSKPWEAQETHADTPADFVSHWKARADFIDIHYHANPDTYTRRFSALEAGRAYKKLGGAVVLKSHLGDTCSVADTCRTSGLPVFGSTSLNAISGGVNLSVIERALSIHRSNAQCGRLIVDLPTVVETAHKSTLTRLYANTSAAEYSQQIAPISDDAGALLPQVLDVLAFCRANEIVISSGHARKPEIMALIDACSALGGIRLLLNQPANPISGFSAQDLVALGATDWLFIEQTTLTYLLGYQDEADFFQVLSEVPNLIYSSDLGQTSQMPPDAWLQKSRDWFAQAGLSQARIDDITLSTPLRMLAP